MPMRSETILKGPSGNEASEDDVVDHLLAEYERRTAGHAFRSGDIVRIVDRTNVALDSAARDVGVVSHTDPIYGTVVLLCLNDKGEEQMLGISEEALEKRVRQ